MLIGVLSEFADELLEILHLSLFKQVINIVHDKIYFAFHAF